MLASLALDFKQQSCILAPQEISALWSCMTGFGPHAFGFHNGGLTSGASVPHRHLQVLEYEMPITRLVDAHVERTGVRPWTAFQVPELPFHHVFVSIPENASPDAVHEAYVKALHLALGKEGVEALNSVDVSFDEGFVTHAPGSNLMVTRKWLYVVPRTDPRPGIHIHRFVYSPLLVAWC